MCALTAAEVGDLVVCARDRIRTSRALGLPEGTRRATATRKGQRGEWQHVHGHQGVVRTAAVVHVPVEVDVVWPHPEALLAGR
jgi:hypothetical protein